MHIEVVISKSLSLFSVYYSHDVALAYTGRIDL